MPSTTQDLINLNWATYDTEERGFLDKEETKKFVCGVIDGGFDEEAFDEAF